MNTEVSKEMLDVVDADDSVVGVMTRGEIHARGLMHRAVHILVFNESGELFLQKRSMKKDNNPGEWDSSAAGHVDSGENYYDCAAREITEELGVTATAPFQALFKLSAIPATGMEHCIVYKTIHNGPFTLQADEIDEGRWVSAAEMDRRVADDDCSMTEVLKIIWRKLNG